MHEDKDFKDNIFLQQKLGILVSNAVRDINTEPGLTKKEQAADVKSLGGISRPIMFDFLNSTYRTGMDLHINIKQMISKNRPKGGPKKTDTDTHTIFEKIKIINKRMKSK